MSLTDITSFIVGHSEFHRVSPPFGSPSENKDEMNENVPTILIHFLSYVLGTCLPFFVCLYFVSRH